MWPTLATAYASRQPFPHVHLVDFFDDRVARRLVEEFPAPADGPWVHYKHYNEDKIGLTDHAAYPPFVAEVIDELNSPAFVQWLSELTGIAGLVADPTLEGGGLHQNGRGGFLNIHADFTRHHHDHRLRRRINVIVYLNPEWREEWGGAIELWDPKMRRAVVRVPPLFNHAIIFNTNERSFHGFPDPVLCPEGVWRRSLALYYYTVESATNVRARATNYQARPDDARWKAVLIWADKTAVRWYSALKARMGLSDAFVGQMLARLAAFRTHRPRSGAGPVR